jgi:hypothetical protein
MAIIRSNLLKLMSRQDRKEFGKAGLLPEECGRKTDNRAEIEMHNLFKGFLYRRRLRYIYANPNKRSPLPPGWPDFSVYGPIAKTLFIEFKTPTGVISEDQRQVMESLAIIGHTVYIPHSYEEARDLTGKHFGLF